jgi:hypothetical protein
LSDTVGNPHHARFLEGHHVVEVVGEILEKGLLRGARIADHRRHAEFAKQVEGDVLDGAHEVLPPVGKSG